MQEIFNKVEQNQLQRTKNVGKFSIRAEMSCGTPRTDPSHPLVNRLSGWMNVLYMPKG